MLERAIKSNKCVRRAAVSERKSAFVETKKADAMFRRRWPQDDDRVAACVCSKSTSTRIHEQEQEQKTRQQANVDECGRQVSSRLIKGRKQHVIHTDRLYSNQPQ